MGSIIEAARRVIGRPRGSLASIARYTFAAIRGSCSIAYFRVFRKSVRIEFPFFVFSKVRIIGPGKVSIGARCHVQENVFKGLTIITYTPDSVVSIGEKCLLGGLTIRCRHRVEVGAKTMTAVSLIQDSFFANADAVRSRGGKSLVPEPKPVAIGKNVWLGIDSIVLGGCRIGDDSVLSVGAWCHGIDVGDRALVSGNPAKRPLPIDKVLRLKGVA